MGDERERRATGDEIRPWFSAREFLIQDDASPQAIGGTVIFDGNQERIHVAVSLADLFQLVDQSGRFTRSLSHTDDPREVLHTLAVIGSLMQSLTLNATEAHDELQKVIERRRGGWS